MRKPTRFLSLVLLALILIAGSCRNGAAAGKAQTRAIDQQAMVYVPAGKFTMGSQDAQVDEALALCQEHRPDCERSQFEDEQPSHEVALDAFWIDKTEVTNAQYQRCVAAGACTERGCPEQAELAGDTQPVVCVTWEQAQAYCQWVGGSLPSEAQWEYAARGPQGTQYPWGNEFDGSRLNYCDAQCPYDWADKSVDDGYAKSSPVGSFPSGTSWCGALDMAGNGWEWVMDFYGAYPAERQENPLQLAGATQRVLRGGAYDLDPVFLRATIRNWGASDSWSPVSGFRCTSPGQAGK